MIELDGRKILEDGTVICDQTALMDMLYFDLDISGIFCSDQRDEQEWSSAARECDAPELGPKHALGEMYQSVEWYDIWFTPPEYRDIDLRQWCLAKCSTQQELDRTNLEVDAFEARGMVPIMKHLIYCVDVWRQNGIVWGVGRGSSVCSLVLHLIGINRINPLDFDLDLHEWLK